VFMYAVEAAEAAGYKDTFYIVIVGASNTWRVRHGGTYIDHTCMQQQQQQHIKIVSTYL